MLFQPGGLSGLKYEPLCSAAVPLSPPASIVVSGCKTSEFFPSQKGQVGPAEEHDPIPIVVLRHVRASLDRAKLN